MCIIPSILSYVSIYYKQMQLKFHENDIQGVTEKMSRPNQVTSESRFPRILIGDILQLKIVFISSKPVKLIRYIFGAHGDLGCPVDSSYFNLNVTSRDLSMILTVFLFFSFFCNLGVSGG